MMAPDPFGFGLAAPMSIVVTLLQILAAMIPPTLNSGWILSQVDNILLKLRLEKPGRHKKVPLPPEAHCLLEPSQSAKIHLECLPFCQLLSRNVSWPLFPWVWLLDNIGDVAIFLRDFASRYSSGGSSYFANLTSSFPASSTSR